MRYAIMAAALLAASPVAAQVGNPATMAPGAAVTEQRMPAPHETNAQDRLFVQLATIGGMAEVEAGRFAGQRAGKEVVKGFARRMVEEHGAANDRLAGLAKDAGVAQPQELDAEHRAMREELERAGAEDFDRVYILGQIVAHQKTAQLLEWQIGSGQDPALKDYAVETLPTVLRHLEMAQRIAAGLTGQSPLTLVGRPADEQAAER